MVLVALSLGDKLAPGSLTELAGPAWGLGWASPGGRKLGACTELHLPVPSILSISNKELSDLIEQLQKNADQVERNIVDTEAKMQSVSTQLSPSGPSASWSSPSNDSPRVTHIQKSLWLLQEVQLLASRE